MADRIQAIFGGVVLDVHKGEYVASMCSSGVYFCILIFFFFQAEDGIRDSSVTGVQTCALPIYFQVQIVVGSVRTLDDFGSDDLQLGQEIVFELAKVPLKLPCGVVVWHDLGRQDRKSVV